MAKDAEYRRLIHTARWVKLRHSVLTAHPLCQRCEREGRIAAAREVHHIRPVEEAISKTEKERLMFNPNNLMALCHACHVQTHTEMGRSGKEATKARNERQIKESIARLFGENSSVEEAPGGIF